MKEILDSRFLLTHYATDDEDTLSRTRTKLAELRKGRRGCFHRDLPSADCVIAVTALRAGARVVTNDPHFSKVKGLRTT